MALCRCRASSAEKHTPLESKKSSRAFQTVQSSAHEQHPICFDLLLLSNASVKACIKRRRQCCMGSPGHVEPQGCGELQLLQLPTGLTSRQNIDGRIANPRKFRLAGQSLQIHVRAWPLFLSL